MNWQSIAFYLFALFVLNKVYWFFSDRQLQKKTGASLPRIRTRWTDPFGLRALWDVMQLAWTLDNYNFFSNAIKENGTTIVADLLWLRSVMTVDPENIKAILATQFEDYGKGPQFTSAWKQFLGNGIFNADGQTWKHSRAMLRPQFLKSRVADLDIMQTHAAIMVGQITLGETTDFSELAFRMTLDTATDFLFGESTGTLEGKLGDRGFAHTFAKIQELQIKRMMQGPFWQFVGFGNHIKDLDTFVDYYVQETLGKPIDEKVDDESASFLDVLAQDTRDPVVLRDQLVSTLLAGRDTTAATLSWLLKHLSNDPVRYTKLRAEVLGTMGTSGKATYAELKGMSYLNACIDETLRLYPIVPMNIRESLRDTTLPRGGGPEGKAPMAVRKGTQVFYIPLVMQRMQDIPDVEDWQPERWADWTPKPWTYIPFNGGPRICLGQNFATVEISVVLAQIAQKYARLENADEGSHDYAMRYDIILTPRHGTKVKFYEE